MRIEIREAELADRDALRELMNRYIFDFYQYPRPEEERLEALLDVLMEKQAGIQFVAVHEGELVGFATLYFTYSTLRSGKVVIMNDLFVTDKCRSQGVGTKLFRACSQYAAYKGYRAMLWETSKDNVEAQQFYEKMGGERDEWYPYSIKPRIGIGD
ncbi:GNAT family N-acetyltransferase [Paenibacillus sp. FJAT-26967]|uniref:GNAT family N-acetyltransferase n=1 Tax=Paenibacillus sp. FJAT-26967 TaxID=1729690 RepID=UPI000837B547|nr:GNAT family N-acetyltransferase [Paenibacillus sp. FJAT-26967]